MGMLLELFCWSIAFSHSFCWFFSCCSLEILPLFLMIALFFPRVNILQHVSKGDLRASFLNQILHLANPHDKLSTFVLYPSLGFPSIYRLTLGDPRLGHLSLSLLSYVGRRFRDGEHEL
jgi:hypothetical protein